MLFLQSLCKVEVGRVLCFCAIVDSIWSIGLRCIRHWSDAEQSLELIGLELISRLLWLGFALLALLFLFLLKLLHCVSDDFPRFLLLLCSWLLRLVMVVQQLLSLVCPLLLLLRLLSPAARGRQRFARHMCCGGIAPLQCTQNILQVLSRRIVQRLGDLLRRLVDLVDSPMMRGTQRMQRPIGLLRLLKRPGPQSQNEQDAGAGNTHCPRLHEAAEAPRAELGAWKLFQLVRRLLHDGDAPRSVGPTGKTFWSRTNTWSKCPP
mmetsp:Transcript_44547/g.72199  ORF Transcript_44547/g.72199 Transcript_44547/m.72199 type:complete len:263 (+) Transcript_44547:820-1608(+)